MYALIQNNAVAVYPYTDAQLRRDNPDTSFPRELTDEARAAWGVLPVSPVAQPAYDPLTQNCIELTPVSVNGGWEQNWAVVPASSEEIAERKQALQDDIVAATQQRLDDFARTRSYDGVLSACTYATSTVPKFATEGRYCVEARDATWAALYQILAEVEAGTRPIPTSFADIEADLPALVWPT